MNCARRHKRPLFVAMAWAGLLRAVPHVVITQSSEDSLAVSIESARKTRDEPQLQSLKAQLEQRMAQNSNDFQAQYDLALVHSYLIDVYESKKDKKGASASVDKAIEAAQRAIQLHDKSADAHSLLGDLYGRKISLSNPMFAGPKYGPKADEEDKRALALDDKNAHVWAVLGRKYLMTPKMFGGDVSKAIDSFQKSLALDTSQDETWVGLAKAYQKQGDKASARDAIHHALQLNPESQLAKQALATLEK
jgi:tetratricopeptide (TPR) repeat protein